MKVKQRSNRGQKEVKQRSNRGQTEVKQRSNRGQTEVKQRSNSQDNIIYLEPASTVTMSASPMVCVSNIGICLQAARNIAHKLYFSFHSFDITRAVKGYKTVFPPFLFAEHIIPGPQFRYIYQFDKPNRENTSSVLFLK